MTASPRLKTISRALYGILDSNIIPEDQLLSVLDSISTGLGEISKIALDISIDPKVVNELITKSRKKEKQAIQKLSDHILEALSSKESILITEYYYLELINVLLNSLPESDREQARIITEGAGIDEKIRDAVKDEYLQLVQSANEGIANTSSIY